MSFKTFIVVNYFQEFSTVTPDKCRDSIFTLVPGQPHSHISNIMTTKHIFHFVKYCSGFLYSNFNV